MPGGLGLVSRDLVTTTFVPSLMDGCDACVTGQPEMVMTMLRSDGHCAALTRIRQYGKQNIASKSKTPNSSNY